MTSSDASVKVSTGENDNAAPQRDFCIDPSAIEWCYHSFLTNKAENTRREYTSDLAIFATWRGDPDILTALKAFVAQGPTKAIEEGSRYCMWLFAPGVARRTAMRRLAVLKSMMSQLTRDGVITWTLSVPPPRRTANDRRYDRNYDQRRPDADLVSTLLAELNQANDHVALRDRLVVYFACVLLLRPVEIARLRLSDINWAANEIPICGRTEGDRRGCGVPRVAERRIPIPAAIARDLHAWCDIAESAGAEHLFVRMHPTGCVLPTGLSKRSFTFIVNRWCKKIGCRPMSMRLLRSGGMSIMLDQTRTHEISPVDIADLAGICNVAQLRRYWTHGNCEGKRTAVEAAIKAVRPA
jgi:integrase